MKKNYMNLILIAVVSLFITTACSKDDDGEQTPIAVSFKTLVANGSATETTSALTLTFDKAIEGLTADDLTLTAGTTGATKGTLTAKGQGVYELAVSGITASGEVSISAAKVGYTITPASNKTNVFVLAVITNKALITAIEAATKKTFTKNAAGDVEVPANQVMIDGITTLNVSFKELTSLEGIEYFTKLTELQCFVNKLTTLDVSKNTALTTLWCFSNELTALDVSKNTALTDLICFSNELTALDVSKNTALTDLTCYNNKLTALDVTKNTALTVLNCGFNKLTVLDVSKNIALAKFSCQVNSLTALDITTLTAIDWLFMQCGDQGSELTLTLTAAQKAAIIRDWYSDSANINVTLQEVQ